MGQPNRINGDTTIVGNLTVSSMTPVDDSVDDGSIKTGANVNALKLQMAPRAFYSQPNTSAASETRAIYTVYGSTAEVIAFKVGAIGAAAGAATVTVDLKVNGTSILTSMVTVTNTLAAYGTLTASLAAGAATLVAGNVLTVVITATAGGGTLPTGLFCEAVIIEDAQ